MACEDLLDWHFSNGALGCGLLCIAIDSAGFTQHLELGNELPQMRAGKHVLQPIRQERVFLRNVERMQRPHRFARWQQFANNSLASCFNLYASLAVIPSLSHRAL